MNRSAWLAALCLMAPPAFGDPIVAEELRKGDAALAEFDLDAALTAFRAAYAIDPQNYDANWNLARALCDRGTLTPKLADQKPLYVEAEKIARKAVRLNEKDSRGHTTLAIAVGKLALFEGGKRKVQLSKEIKTEAARALELDKQDDLAYHVLGIWNREMVELNWVLKKFAELLYGRFPPASMDNALAYLQQATKIAPTTVPHRVELGITYAATKQWKEAETELTHALAMPQAWVTDEHYKELAKQNLKQVKPHLK